ncbi:MAG: hypothetical protein O3A63_01005 [Proteobacteria bacterium]|nr:hypothetical protein [Pseudomonadota bacterium]
MADPDLRFHYLHVAGAQGDRDGTRLEVFLRTQTAALNMQIWGIWRGMFGVGSNERLVIYVRSDATKETLDGLSLDQAHCVVKEHLVMTPTVRPVSGAPCQREGLYVFRRFAVNAADVDEIAALSAQAWTTFETSDAYQAEPQGLFRSVTSSGSCMMLLVTWYDGLESWQISRRPPPEAMQNFRRRHALTHSTSAVACNLAGEMK